MKHRLDNERRDLRAALIVIATVAGALVAALMGLLTVAVLAAIGGADHADASYFRQRGERLSTNAETPSRPSFESATAQNVSTASRTPA